MVMFCLVGAYGGCMYVDARMWMESTYVHFGIIYAIIMHSFFVDGWSDTMCVCFIGLHNLLLAAEYVSDLVYFSFLSLTLANEWIREVQNVNDIVWSFLLGTDSWFWYLKKFSRAFLEKGCVHRMLKGNSVHSYLTWLSMASRAWFGSQETETCLQSSILTSKPGKWF